MVGLRNVTAPAASDRGNMTNTSEGRCVVRWRPDTGFFMMAGDREQRVVSRRCLPHDTLRLARVIRCAVAFAIRRKSKQEVSASVKSCRLSHWQPSRTCRAFMLCGLWAMFKSPVSGSSTGPAPPLLPSPQSGYNTTYSTVVPAAERPQYVADARSGSFLKGLSEGSLVRSARTVSQEDVESDGYTQQRRVSPASPASQKEASTKMPTKSPAATAMSWEVFVSLLKKPQGQLSTSSEEGAAAAAMAPPVSSGGPTEDDDKARISGVPDVVADATLSAQKAVRSVDAGSEELLPQKEQQGPSQSLQNEGRDTKNVQEATSARSSFSLVLPERGVPLSKGILNQVEARSEFAKDATALKGPENDDTKTTPEQRPQELVAMPPSAAPRTASTKTAGQVRGRALPAISEHETSNADTVNVSEERVPTKHSANRGLDILLKLVEESTFPLSETDSYGRHRYDNNQEFGWSSSGEKPLHGGGFSGEHPGYTGLLDTDDDRRSLDPMGTLYQMLSRSMSSKQTEHLGEGGRKHSGGPPEPTDEDVARSNARTKVSPSTGATGEPVAKERTSVANGASGSIVGRISVQLEEPVSQENPLPEVPVHIPAESGFRGSPAIPKPSSGPSMEGITAPQKIDHSEESVPVINALVLHPLFRSSTAQADGVPHVVSDDAKRFQDFLNIFSADVLSEDNDNALETAAIATTLPVNAPYEPSGDKSEDTVHPDTETKGSQTHTRWATDVAPTSPAHGPHVHGSGGQITLKSGSPQESQKLHEGMKGKTLIWSLSGAHEEKVDATLTEPWSADALSKQARPNASSSQTTLEKRQISGAEGARLEKPLGEPHVPPEAAVPDKDTADTSQNMAPRDVGGLSMTAPPLTASSQQTRRTRTPVQSTVSKAHPPAGTSSATLSVSGSPRDYSGETTREATTSSHAPRPQSRGPTDHTAGYYGETPMGASAQHEKADAELLPEKKFSAVQGLHSPTTGKSQLNRRQLHSDKKVELNGIDGGGVISQQEVPAQGHVDEALEGADTASKTADASSYEEKRVPDPALETPKGILMQLRLHKERLFSTISALLTNVGTGVRQFAAFLDNEDPEDQSTFLKVASSYPEVLRAWLFFRLASLPTPISIKRFREAVRTCESMVKSVRRAATLLEVGPGNEQARESVCKRLSEQNLDIAAQSVHVAQLFAHVLLTSYQLACFYLRERRFREALSLSATEFSTLTHMYSTFLDVAPLQEKLAKGFLENQCPVQVFDSGDFTEKEISLEQQLVTQLEFIAEQLKIASRLEAALHKLAGVFRRRRRIVKLSPPELPDSSKTRMRFRKRTAALYSR